MIARSRLLNGVPCDRCSDSPMSVPIAIVVVYVAWWPAIHVRPVTVGVASVLVGFVAVGAALYWAYLPLASVGIAGGTSKEGSDVGHLVGLRLIGGAGFVAASTAAIAWLVGRAFGNR
jgi:hypothetical protein